MKHATLAALLLAVPGTAWAQKEQSQEELKAKRDKKLADPWLKNADWITDYDKARETAKSSGRLIFAYFTRSYSP